MKNLSIPSVLNLETGEYIEAIDFFKKSKPEIWELRLKAEAEINTGNKVHVCFCCHQQIKVRGRYEGDRRMHFAHLQDSDVCPIKTGKKFKREEILKIKYNGAKESILHYNLKSEIATACRWNQETKLGITKVELEKNQKSESGQKWKRPDVSTKYKGYDLLFDLQLSTTFLSVIVDRQLFYRDNKKFLVWVFSNFNEDVEKRRHMMNDIYYSNNRNAFIITEETRKRSQELKDLVLLCIFEKPELHYGEIYTTQEREYIRLSDLKFDEEKSTVFYYDFDDEQNRLLRQLEIENSEIIRLVKEGTRDDVFDWFLNHKLSNVEFKQIKFWFMNDVEKVEKVERNSYELRVVLSMILHKLNSPFLVQLFRDDFDLRDTVFDILSLKLNKIINCDFQSPKQIVQRLLQYRPEYADYLMLAMDVLNHSLRTDPKVLAKYEKVRYQKVPKAVNMRLLNVAFPELATPR